MLKKLSKKKLRKASASGAGQRQAKKRVRRTAPSCSLCDPVDRSVVTAQRYTEIQKELKESRELLKAEQARHQETQLALADAHADFEGEAVDIPGPGLTTPPPRARSTSAVSQGYTSPHTMATDAIVSAALVSVQETDGGTTLATTSTSSSTATATSAPVSQTPREAFQTLVRE
jgi:hypothetical protein